MMAESWDGIPYVLNDDATIPIMAWIGPQGEMIRPDTMAAMAEAGVPGYRKEEILDVLGADEEGRYLCGIVERVANGCLLYTSDAADDLLCVDLGGRRIIKTTKY